MKNSMVVIAAVIALLVGAGGGFYAGMQYQQSKAPQVTGGNFAGGGAASGFRTGGARGTGAGSGMRPVVGQITSSGNGTITVKLADGSSKIVLISGSTTIAKTSPGAASDLTTGVTVAAFGTTNSDGSVTATNVQINPTTRMGGGTGASQSGSQGTAPMPPTAQPY